MPDLAWWIQNFKQSAFRLETLPAYDSPRETEMLAAFLRGEEVRLPDDFAWLNMVRAHTNAGRSMTRVRIVGRPVSDYERFELSLYPQCLAAGEDIRIAETTSADSDFWLFDNHTVILLRYDAAGRFLGTELAENVVAYRRIRDLALENSVPLSEWTTRAART